MFRIEPYQEALGMLGSLSKIEAARIRGIADIPKHVLEIFEPSHKAKTILVKMLQDMEPIEFSGIGFESDN